MAAERTPTSVEMERISRSPDQHNPPINPFSFVDHTLALNPNIERDLPNVERDVCRSNPAYSPRVTLFRKRKLKPLPMPISSTENSKNETGERRLAYDAVNVMDRPDPSSRSCLSWPIAKYKLSSVVDFCPEQSAGSHLTLVSRGGCQYITHVNWERAGNPELSNLFFQHGMQAYGPLVEAGITLRSETLERIAALESALRIATSGPPRLARGARTMARAMARANAYRSEYFLGLRFNDQDRADT